ncbi:hypothetical protein DLAC_05611 [Tieghemostelium lacteum]|uniref:Uncharacterized protein n=1 Tax=Tieghemostelium lacteum TaxID=361077 RepID=A0A151ZGA7_TIELA|nr:hypothetical protein DLAC_05611 [Tieghemostelium lacteum]|eukprot:KYQ93006.1 hypothetical protein DLAC_05611 [Tieghemostelium lacteum]
MSNETTSTPIGTKIEFDQLDEGISRIVKKQKTTLSKTLTDIDSVISSLKTCKTQLNLIDDSMEIDSLISKSIGKLHTTTSENKMLTKVANEHKELHAPISKFGKVIDKNFRNDIESSTKDDIEFDKEILNEIILQHLYRIGRFDVADLLQKEADISNIRVGDDLKEKLISNQKILTILESHGSLKEAIQWCRDKRDSLKKINSYLEFNLHRLQFILLLVEGQSMEALTYARVNLSEFSESHLKEIQSLMGSFAYVNRLSLSPYAYMFTQKAIDDQWQEIKIQFGKNASTIMGLAQESPLSVTLTVGMKALPTFLKLSTFSVLKDINGENLTFEIKVAEEYNFHSIFACPVSREQSTKSNPPVMLQCGHLLCKNSTTRLIKGSSTKFKCPYCPVEQSLSNVKQIYF